LSIYIYRREDLKIHTYNKTNNHTECPEGRIYNTMLSCFVLRKINDCNLFSLPPLYHNTHSLKNNFLDCLSIYLSFLFFCTLCMIICLVVCVYFEIFPPVNVNWQVKCLSVAQGIFYDKREGSQILEIRDKLVSMCTLCGRGF
jgi:hypothetical protein